MSRTLKIAGTMTLLLLLAAFALAAANAQTYPQPTNVTAENTTDGHVLVSWADDAAPVHRVGWTHDADFRAAEGAGDWLEAFHFADSKRDTDYTIKYLPRGQQYWFIVGTTNERFTGANYSEWTSITTTADSTTQPSNTNACRDTNTNANSHPQTNSHPNVSQHRYHKEIQERDLPCAWHYVLQQDPHLHSLCNDGRVSGQRRTAAWGINFTQGSV